MEFSLEYSIDQIHDKRTKEIFREVVSSYNNQNYRSAVVMLYTVVMCDLVFKLQDLRDIYLDQKANDILEKIDYMQTSDPTSPRWEEILVKRIGEETELLSHIELDAISQLKNSRNLSAHPVLKNMDVLYVPTKEKTIAHIREMVEAVLVKPPVLSKKFMNTFLDGISSIKNDFINPDNTCDIKIFGVFLQTRYFRFMGNTLKKKVFRSLWKFVFNLDNTECNENRTVNFYALECLYNSSKEVLKDYIKSEPKFFPMSNKYFTLECEFLLKNNEIFHFLSEDVQIAIKNFYARDTNMNTKILGAFLSVSIEKHCDNLENCFNEISPTQYDIKKSLKLLYEHANNLCKGFEVLRCFIRIFAQS